MAFRGVGTSKADALQKFANLLGFLPKPELERIAGETCIKATHRPALPTPRRKISGDVGRANIYLFFWISEKCRVPEALPPASPVSPAPTRGADAALAPADRGATVIPGARGYDSTHGRSRALPTANPQTFAHVAVTFRPQRICRGITESREISWLGQAWLSATQLSPAAFKAIYAGLPTGQLLDGFPHRSLFPKHHDPTTARY